MQPQSHPSWSVKKSASIQYLKKGAVFLAIFIALYLLGVSLLHTSEGLEKEEAVLSGTRAEGMKIFGLDGQKNGFWVKSLRAKQDTAREDIYYFEKVQADFQTEAQEKIQVRADNARLDKKENILFLENNVHFVHEQGYDFTTSRANIDLTTHVVRGDDVVEGEGPAGHIHAQGFEIFDKGERVVFGKTIAHIDEKQAS